MSYLNVQHLLKYCQNLGFTALLLLTLTTTTFAQSPADWVNPFIGTTNYGTTNPGAIVPRGMVSVVPFNVAGKSALNKRDKDDGWWSTPYSWDNKYFTGYSHVNLSGVGCPELGVILLMPTTGELVRAVVVLFITGVMIGRST